MKLNFSIILVIVFSSILIGIVYNQLNPKGLSFIREKKQISWADDSTSINSIHSDSAFINNPDNSRINSSQEGLQDFAEPKAIKIDFAYELFLKGTKFIDARPVEEYQESHIKGAINIPFYGSENYDSVLNKISKKEIIVTYCSGDDCDLSILLGNELFDKGYKRVYVFFGGWNDWQKKGYPIEKK